MPGAALLVAISLLRTPPAPRAMVIAPAPNRQVMVARRNDDGTLETACVDNEEAVKALLARSKPKNQ
jgi:hypothetical protein